MRRIRLLFQAVGITGDVHFVLFTLGVGNAISIAVTAIASYLVNVPAWALIGLYVSVLLVAVSLVSPATRAVVSTLQSRQRASVTAANLAVPQGDPNAEYVKRGLRAERAEIMAAVQSFITSGNQIPSLYENADPSGDSTDAWTTVDRWERDAKRTLATIGEDVEFGEEIERLKIYDPDWRVMIARVVAIRVERLRGVISRRGDELI